MGRTDDEVRAEWCRRLGWHYALDGRFFDHADPAPDAIGRSEADLAEAVRAWCISDWYSVSEHNVGPCLSEWGWRTPIENLRAVLEGVDGQ